jgi:hypothetical protein
MIFSVVWWKTRCIWTIPHITDDLKITITEYTLNVDRAILNTVFEHTDWHVNKCLETGGGHFWTLLLTLCIVIVRCKETFWSPCISNTQPNSIYQTTWHHIPTDHNPYNLHCKNLKYNTNNGALTLSLLMLYIYGPTFGNAESSFFLFAAQCFNSESTQKVFLWHSCV